MEIVATLAGSERPEAMRLLNALRTPDFEPALFKLVRERGRLLTAAWLTQTGHTRPGMAPGLPLKQARARAAELESQIRDAAHRARLKTSDGPRAQLTLSHVVVASFARLMASAGPVKVGLRPDVSVPP